MSIMQNISDKQNAKIKVKSILNKTTCRAFQISDNIDIKAFKAAYSSQPVFFNSEELFYRIDSGKYVSIFKYGATCFLNMDDASIAEFKQIIAPFCLDFFEFDMTEEFQIETNCEEVDFGFKKIKITTPDQQIIRLIMLNVAQSIALTYYFQLTKKLLEESSQYTLFLERKGKLGISGQALKRFIGKTLNLKNIIVENLYILDSPPGTLYDINLKNIDAGLKKSLDMQRRSGNVHEELKILKEHLSLFSDIMHHRTSIMLEWVIMILVFVEVVDLIAGKLY